MTLRPTQSSTFALVRYGLQFNMSLLTQAQEQLASGKRISRPSDDPIGTSISIALRRQKGGIDTYRKAIEAARPFLESANDQLSQAAGFMSDGRAIIIQAMNGTLSASDRVGLAGQIDLVRQGMLEIANARSGERYLFSGTQTGVIPFEEYKAAGKDLVEYVGDDKRQTVLIGRGVDLEINIAGEELFAKNDFAGVAFGEYTGAALGTSANSGSGYSDLIVRHDSTTAVLGEGLALVSGGAFDDLLGDHSLVVDAAAGTVTLNGGDPVVIPPTASADAADVTIEGPDGQLLHIDFSGWSGLDFSGTVTGNGSISLDGTTFATMDFTETNLELLDDATGRVVHVDTTSIKRAGNELLVFTGAANLFDTLAGIAEDLRNGDGILHKDILDRIGRRLQEFDRHHDNLLSGIGQLGSRTERLNTTEDRVDEVELHLKGLISNTEDSDMVEVMLNLSKAETTLQVAQATGARLIQQTLLNYL